MCLTHQINMKHTHTHSWHLVVQLPGAEGELDVVVVPRQLLSCDLQQDAMKSTNTTKHSDLLLQ